MKGMILAAGIGSRLRPITDKIPKALLQVHDRPLLDYAICYLRKSGIREIIINIHHHAEQIVAFIEKQNYLDLHIEFSDERDKLLDTGGAIKKASWFFKGEDDFLLMASDVITNVDLCEFIQAHRQSKADVTLAVKDRETSRSLLFDDSGRLAGWRDNQTGELKFTGERKSYSFDAGFSGLHIISTHMLEHMPDEVFSITEFYLDIGDKFSIQAFRHDKNTWLEFGRISRIRQIEQSETISKIVDW
jgi:N-acetyl-alpha-D-muramate 1-phosphate uridylyltransferase